MKKFLLIMRLSVFILLISILQVSATSYSQGKVSLTMNNATISEVLDNIESKSEIKFLYRLDYLNLNKRINVNVKNAEVIDLLNEVLTNFKNLSYSVLKGNLIVISPKIEYIIAGKVTDENGNALPGVNIVEEGTTNGTITDLDGNYSISVKGEESVLTFSFIGYKNQSITVGKQTILNVQLIEDTELEEVIVVGYGTQKKGNVTGSVSAIGGEELAKKTVPDIRQALQGEATGLTIIDHGGVPGSEDLRVNIRGVGSLSAGTYPLILVDGIEMPINDIHPNDIASISVLKDAASSAIYGAKAANGVILITTKRGSKKGFSVDYDGYYGIQTPASLPELIGAEDYLNLVNEAMVNAGMQPKYSDDYIQNTLSGTDPYNYPYTNFFEELFNPAPVWNHSLNIRGGNENARVAFSVNHLDQDGMLKNVNSKRNGFRLNTDFDLSKKITLSINVSYNTRSNKQPNRLNDAIKNIVGTSPATVLQYPNGAYGLNKDNTSALAALEVGGSNEFTSGRMNLQTGFDWNIFDELSLKGNLSYNEYNSKNKEFKAEHFFYSPLDKEDIVAQWTPSNIWQNHWISKEIVARLLLDYKKEFNGHNFYLLGGFELTDYQASYIAGSRKNVYSNNFQELNMGDVEGMENFGYTEGSGLVSYLGRFNYSFKDRYLFETNVRYDGSSRFAEGHKWGFFPSFSAGWVISNESFMESANFLSNLKLRASWGQLGNQNIGLYRFTSTIYSNYGYNFNDTEVSGYSQVYYANTDITWETSEMTNIGIDFSLLDNKIEVTADWFKKETKDVLLVLPISPMVGLRPSEINAGIITNTGWELSIVHKNKIKDFFYSVGFNISDVKNELTDFAQSEPSISGWTILKEGEPVYALYGYKSDGLFQSQEEIDAHATQPNQQDLRPGDIKLVDQNGDGEINDDDRTVIGSTIPRYTVGANINLEYKGFDFSAVFQGVLKAENYFYGEINEGPNYEVFSTPRVLDRWTPDNPGASFPRLEASTNKNNYLYNDFWIRDASYFRLKNIQVGYTLPTKIVNKVKLERTRMYVGVTNLFTISAVDAGIDPETYDGRFTAYPPVRTFTFGLQIGL